MDAATAGLLGVLAGGFFGLLGGLVTAWTRARSDEAAWQRRRNDDRDKAHREAMRDFVRTATKATQRMHWVAWEAKASSPKSEAAFTAYSKEMRELLADLFASGAVLDMLIPGSEKAMSEETPVIRMVNRITDADELIGDAEIKLHSGDDWAAPLEEGRSIAFGIHVDLMRGYPWSSRERLSS